MRHDVGVVAIGRNEGERLTACLRSAARDASVVVYVDSGSTDGSVSRAEEMGCEIVRLDMSIPFTAARARNEGVRRLIERAPHVRYVQLVDGDCELVEGWICAARDRLVSRPELAVVCGRRRERHPHASVFSRLCDLEWDTPIGDAEACGGDALIRVAAFNAVGGFDPSLIAGEEPELCLRLRQAGWSIERLDAEMTLHDAAMTTLSQWWSRARRAGHAYAEGAHLHGSSPERHWVRQTRRAVLWGGAVPAIAIGGALPTMGASLLLLSTYGLSAARVYRSARQRGRAREDALAYAVFTTLGKLPEMQGVLEYHWNRLRGQPRGLIEYK